MNCESVLQTSLQSHKLKQDVYAKLCFSLVDFILLVDMKKYIIFAFLCICAKNTVINKW